MQLYRTRWHPSGSVHYHQVGRVIPPEGGQRLRWRMQHCCCNLRMALGDVEQADRHSVVRFLVRGVQQGCQLLDTRISVLENFIRSHQKRIAWLCHG